MSKNSATQKDFLPDLSIPRKDLRNIFQIEDMEYYSQFGKDDMDQSLLPLLEKALENGFSPTSGHFDPAAILNDIKVAYTAEPECGYMIWADYTPENESGDVPFTRTALVIAQMIMDPNSEFCGEVQPHFLMTGINTIENGQEVFKPEEVLCLCLPEGREDETLYVPYSEDTFKACICYAEYAATSTIIGYPLNMEDNQEWLEDDNIARAIGQYEDLIKRTPKEFAENLDELEQLAEEAQREEFYSETRPYEPVKYVLQ